ncbi:MAG: amylo-alpha-1,6-glucosidase [Actinomycetales bacterium]|nr:amylo-alpha-1,6-glucosidase [Actinomycetales bacterium]
MSAWNVGTGAGGLAGAVTILEGSSFCISAPNGDVPPLGAYGAFHGDTRIVSRWDLTVDGAQLEALSAYTPTPFRAVFVTRVPAAAGGDSPLVVERDRDVGAGLREAVTVRNFSGMARRCTLRLAVGADFADLFDVKVGGTGLEVPPSHPAREGELVFVAVTGGRRREVVVDCPGARAEGAELIIELEVPPQGCASASVIATPVLDRRVPPEVFSHGLPPEVTAARRRLADWQARLPTVSFTNELMEGVVRRSVRDLGALRITDPAHPERVVVAAGAPWFMALFGRDSLLTSLMALPLDRSLALGTLRTLADLQGREFVPDTDEEPGRILHEVRLGASAALALGGGSVYYGSVDATPLFVVLLGELLRWGLPDAALRELLPAADRALDWILTWGDRDGDGFVEYLRHGDGLVNQGWKDSWDGVTFADGRLAEPPIALSEVQGYVHMAYRARAEIARHLGDGERAGEWDARADALKAAFNRAFWLEDRGYYALALDAGKRPVDSLASNMGHCLWSGIVEADKAPAVAAHLLSPALFSGWGVRTLARGMGAFNPASYHNGSVWPHDNALIVAGLMRYGFVAEAQRIAVALMEAATLFEDRLPELFCGFDRELHPTPVAYPTSCSPQAWAAATPIHLLRTLLRFEADAPHRQAWIAPVLPPEFEEVRLTHLRLGGQSFGVVARGAEAEPIGLPDALTLHREPMPPRSTPAKRDPCGSD